MPSVDVNMVFAFTPTCTFTQRHTVTLETIHKAVSLCICRHADVRFKVQHFSSICLLPNLYMYFKISIKRPRCSQKENLSKTFYML